MSNQTEKDLVDAVENASIDEINADNASETVENSVAADALAEAENKAAENWNLYLSARAETDNVRKRAERDVANAHKYALEKFIPELLGVKDSLELGAKAAQESADADNEQLASFLQGSELTVTMFNDVLTKAGVSVINPEGEVFNPELHQAMTMIPNPDLPANTIIEVVQKGYTLNERLLRPAMVIVSKVD